MLNKQLPILSGSLRDLIKAIAAKTDDPIAKEIITVDSYVEGYNNIYFVINEEFGQRIITSILDPLITDEVRMISVRPGDFEVSFLPKGKEPEYTSCEIWGRKNRQTGKPAKIFQKLLKKEFKTKEWEVFSNLIKAELCDCTNFELISGEDIRKYYCDENYYKIDGSLGNSCMRYPEASDYFDIYVDNAKLLVTKKDGLITGRAIVWEVDGITIMDRVYTCFDYLTNCFYDYAKEHYWWIRNHNSLLNTGDEQLWYAPDDDYTNSVHRLFIIPLAKQYSLFPYLDSFRYYDGNKEICNCPDISGFTYSLDCTDGDYSEFESSMQCDRCGATFNDYNGEIPEELCWSDWCEQYYCEDCRWWCEALNDWIGNDDEPVEVFDGYSWEDYPITYVQDKLVTNPNGNESDHAIVEIGSKYYFTRANNIAFNAETSKYEIRSNSQ